MTQPSDATKKSLRTFQCRDQLWEAFETMARELECSVDYLINESMKLYLRQRQGGGAVTAPARHALPPLPQPMAGMPLPVTAPAVPMPRPMPPPPANRLPPPPTNRGLPPPSGSRIPVSHPPQPRHVPPPVPSRPSITQPPPGVVPGSIAPVSSVPGSSNFVGGLTAVYNGERTAVSKEKFIIGRGRQASDLTIKDPNVSRQHAMVEFQNGVYFMVDLGSTNGVEYNGQRVTRKAIAEGDVFRICDHDIAFTYR